ncbi:MAG TPA: SDR family oxidoreductase [Solirubrobacteraceae bacterium]
MSAPGLPEPRPSSAALVTGASAGIGQEIATELAARGHNLVLVARRKDRLEELATELKNRHGVRAEVLGADLSKAASVARLPGRAESLGLEIDVLINNAGFATNGPFVEADQSREIEQVRVLVEAVVALTGAFAPAMAKRGRGAILNIASTAGMQPLPFSAGYSAAKAYVLTFSEAIHQELAPKGVTVTVLAPGPVYTDFWEISGWEVAGGRTFEQAVPKPAWISAQDAARAGVEGLAAGTRVVIPGLRMRAAMEASRYIPHAIKLPAIAWAMRRK